MKPKRWTVLCALALLMLVRVSVGADRPNFLVIVSDDQRPDTIHALGNEIIHSPNLDRLVRDGMTFTRAVCPFPLCVPSRAEILTGRSAFENGVPFQNGRGQRGQRGIKPELVLWGDAMRSGGYHTWYCGKWMNDGSPKTRGYDETSGLFSAGGAGTSGKQPRYNRNGRLITGYRGWTFKTNDGKPELKKGIGLVGKTSRYIADGAVRLLDRKCVGPPKSFVEHVKHEDIVVQPAIGIRSQSLAKRWTYLAVHIKYMRILMPARQQDIAVVKDVLC